ncbi:MULTISPECIES: VOC family protein [Streptomyces]|uniref:VOC family protein n=1 Tax=Streptomyces TaxID=1883 RepID=UPI0004BE16FE|nr:MULTISPECIES: VOC family protein [Streptomyces]QHF95283.1 VOC family protein [Streptomyces sp. NHF165]
MPNELNHLIVHCRDRRESAAFLAELMDAPTPCDWGLFTQVDTSNNVGIDFADALVPPDRINESHLAFLVTDDEFDSILRRLREKSIRFWSDPQKTHEGEINHLFGGRGVYALDPGGTVLTEFITAPYPYC